ncbi:hypothetical protein [Xanthomonas graminis]|uniref:hypothetical protein n=1 Tax=Xanthomonas graminis TaxID=3390026 RepID=UPI0039647FA4
MFLALGCYPVAPASNPSILGRPFLPHATLPLPNGSACAASPTAWTTRLPASAAPASTAVRWDVAGA